MQQQHTMRKLLEFAVQLEENGEAFYRRASLAATRKSIQTLFETLVQEEQKHKEVFQTMMQTLTENYTAEELSTDEYTAYLESYATDAIFSSTHGSEVSLMSNAAAAIDFALQRERDSIWYYHEMKLLVPVSEHAHVDAIIKEERKHIVLLRNARKDL